MKNFNWFTICLCLILESCVTGKIEEPKFSILITESDYELRHYDPRVVAETMVNGDFSEAPNIGFRRLADYIFGNNSKKADIAMTAPVSMKKEGEKIAMTAPVTQKQLKDNAWSITFTMPREYSLETLPRPNSDQVTLRQLPASKFAVVRFSGMNSNETVAAKTESLRRWILKKSLKELGGEPIYARYNPPWTPWFWRRNEVLIEVE